MHHRIRKIFITLFIFSLSLNTKVFITKKKLIKMLLKTKYRNFGILSKLCRNMPSQVRNVLENFRN